jgi:hypothetical protein
VLHVLFKKLPKARNRPIGENSPNLAQDCQMVYFQTKILGKFWSALEWKRSVYSMATWNIFLSFGTFYGHLATWYIFTRFWCVKKNLATLICPPCSFLTLSTSSLDASS